MAGSTSTQQTDLPYNFGVASDRDEVLWTCQRPGGEYSGGIISAAIAQPQIDFLVQHKINQVLILMNDNELRDDYASPKLLQSLYESAGIVVHHEPMAKEGACERILRLIRTAEVRQHRIVAHCTHGIGRSGRVAAGWLSARYLLTPEDATTEVMEAAKTKGIQRLGDVDSLTAWLGEEVASCTIVSTIYHMCEKPLWDESFSKNDGGIYYPPTFEEDGFIHATLEPTTLLETANQFCSGSSGDWLCVALSVSALRAAGIPVRFEVPNTTLPAPVACEYPHIYGCIPVGKTTPGVVVQTFPMERDGTGKFITVTGLPNEN